VDAEAADLKAQLAEEQRRSKEAAARMAADLLSARQELLVRCCLSGIIYLKPWAMEILRSFWECCVRGVEVDKISCGKRE
jgi:hypothetical protein